jgi:hypothetical protein
LQLETEHVFIVGLPRTGTKLVLNILRKSSIKKYQISPETHFLGHFIRSGIKDKIQKYGNLSNDENVYKLVDSIFKNKFNGTYWKLLRSGHLGINKKDFLNAVLKSDRSEKGIYDTILKVHTESEKNVVLGDKTPGNLYHIPKLLEWYPDAKIIHTFRDPRAILASEWLKKRKAVTSNIFFNIFFSLYTVIIIFHVTITWLYAIRLHNKFSKKFPKNYYMLKFEDLVKSPENCIRNLCIFLGDRFHYNMLSPPKVDSSFSDNKGDGIDKEAIDRWKMSLKPWMNAFLLIFTKKFLKEFNYIK